MKRKWSRKKRAVISIILILLFIMCGTIGTAYYVFNKQFSKMKIVSLPKDDKQLGIDSNLYNDSKKAIQDDYVNILLLGSDARETNEASRSDSMIIATIDKKHNKIKFTSLMRDMLVSIDENSTVKQDKLTHAFAYGKALLTLKTVNENFKTDIKDYVKVDFFGLEKIIDYVGGVDINVTQAEISAINGGQNEVAAIEKASYTPVTKAGLQTLNGKQAVAYARIRYVGNADFQRTERQRTVLTQLFDKLSKMNVLGMNNALGQLLPNVETSMDRSTLLALMKSVLVDKISNVQQLRLPIDNHYQDLYIKGIYYLGWDKEPNLEALHKFIYEKDYNSDVLK